MKNTKVYIAGKVTDEDPQQCFDKFQALDQTLTDLGYQVLNPMRIVPLGTGWYEAMAILRPHLLKSDVIIFFPDWTDSVGSVEERCIAMHFKIKIVEYHELNAFLQETCTA